MKRVNMTNPMNDNGKTNHQDSSKLNTSTNTSDDMTNNDIDEIIDMEVYTRDTRELMLSEQSMHDIMNSNISQSRELERKLTEPFDIISLLLMLGMQLDDKGKK